MVSHVSEYISALRQIERDVGIMTALLCMVLNLICVSLHISLPPLLFCWIDKLFPQHIWETDASFMLLIRLLVD